MHTLSFRPTASAFLPFLLPTLGSMKAAARLVTSGRAGLGYSVCTFMHKRKAGNGWWSARSRNVSMPAKPHEDARENLGFQTGPDS